jgi:hypothetical protein
VIKLKILKRSFLYLCITIFLIGCSEERPANNQTNKSTSTSETNQVTTQTTSSPKQQSQKDEGKSIEEQKKLVLEFQHSIFKLEDSSKEIMKKYDNTLAAFSNGSASASQTYNVVKAAKDASEKLRLEYSQFKIPEGLPTDINDKLEIVTFDMSTSYYNKTKSFDYVLKFLDENKPNYLSNAKEEMKNSQDRLMDAMANLSLVNNKLGIKADELR